MAQPSPEPKRALPVKYLHADPPLLADYLFPDCLVLSRVRNTFGPSGRQFPNKPAYINAWVINGLEHVRFYDRVQSQAGSEWEARQCAPNRRAVYRIKVTFKQ